MLSWHIYNFIYYHFIYNYIVFSFEVTTGELINQLIYRTYPIHLLLSYAYEHNDNQQINTFKFYLIMLIINV